MSQSQPTPSEPNGKVADGRSPAAVDGILFGVLAALSLVGIAIADFSARAGLRYWLVMVPIFAGVSIFAGWSRARRNQQSVPTILRAQILHWVALPFAVYLIYLLEATGRLNQEDAGLVALLVLALTTFLAGIHFDWRLAALGALLAVGAACAALVEEFFWVLMIPVALAGVGFVLWRKRAA